MTNDDFVVFKNDINNRFDRIESVLEKIVFQMNRHEEILDQFRSHAVRIEHCWKAYTDVDKIHEDRLDNHEERIGKLELMVS